MADLANIELLSLGETLREPDPCVRAIARIYVASGASAGNPPAVSVVSPVGTVATDGAITLDVTDDTGLRRVVIVARFAELGIEEVVHQGDRFAARYTGTATPIASGSRIAFTRIGGWPAPPVIDVYAVDTSGGEA